MVPPIIALVFAFVVAFLTFQTSQIDTRMAPPATPSASIDDEAADDSEDMADEAEEPEEEEVDLGE